jgi:hypothetical protein
MKISVNGLLMMSLVVSCAWSPAWAAERAPLTPERVEQYIRQYQADVSRREARVSSLTDQIKAIDEDIEHRVKSVLATLASVRDSVDSQSRVMRIKKEAIEGLQKSIEYYVRERDRRLRTLAASGSAVDGAALTQDAIVLNTRIDRRIEQIALLAGSFEQHKEFQNYQRYQDNDIDYRRETLEFQRHKRLVTAGAIEKSRIIEEMRTAISRLRRKCRQLEHSLEMTSSAKRSEVLTAEYKQVGDLMRKRQDQLNGLLATSGGKTKAMGQRAAFEMNQHFDDLIDEIPWDMNRLKSRVRERDTARGALQSVRNRLARAEAALARMQAK